MRHQLLTVVVVQYCMCDAGYDLVRDENNRPLCRPVKNKLPVGDIVGIVVGGLLGCILSVAAMIFLLHMFWLSITAYARKRMKLQGPPGQMLSVLSVMAPVFSPFCRACVQEPAGQSQNRICLELAEQSASCILQEHADHEDSVML